MKSGSTVPVYYRIYQRFYSDSKAVIDKSASAHWQDFSRYFTVRNLGGERFQHSGYGFGASGTSGFINRVFSWVGNIFQLANLNFQGLRQDVNEAKRLVKKMGLVFSQDAFRQVCTLNFLNRRLLISKPRLILIIGDGHGILTALLHARFPSARFILVDLGSVLFFQSYHLHKAFPDASQVIADETSLDGSEVFTFCPADRLDAIPPDNIDLAINIASMQEMDLETIASYFNILRNRATGLFYCCNRLEKRIGQKNIRFMEYPWVKDDVHHVDESCSWHQWFFGFASSPHVRLAGVSVPFMHRYDGQHWHRLTSLSPIKKND